jgi:hypothetical protein
MVEVAKSMKIILLACRRKVQPVLIKTAFFRGKMKKQGVGNSGCSDYYAPLIRRRIERDPETAACNVTKLLNSVHTLFTPHDSLPPCQRREIRNGEKNRQAKI